MLLGRTRVVSRQVMSRVVDGKIDSLVEFGLICTLVFEGGGTQAEIAVRTAQDPASVSRMIEDLEQRKVLRRRRDPKDRRKFCVEATAGGRAMVESSRDVMMLALEEVLKGLAHGDRVMLRDVLRKLVGAHEEPKTCATSAPR